jgi:hypothetical protein
VLQNGIKSLRTRGFISLQDGKQTSFFSWMNQLQMNVQLIENMDGRLLELLHMNTSPSNVQNVGLFFLFILSMVSSSGTSCMAHIQWNYSTNSYVRRFCRFAVHIQVQGPLLSWIMRESITLRYNILLAIISNISGAPEDV